MLEINCADRLEDNAGPLSALFYSISVLYCMTTSLAYGGEGLGTMGEGDQPLDVDIGMHAGECAPVAIPLQLLGEIALAQEERHDGFL